MNKKIKFTSNVLFQALIDGILHNSAFKHVKDDGRQEHWTNLLRDLRIYEDDTDHVADLRRRLVVGASEWLSGLHNSKENEKEKFGYSDREWKWIWSLMLNDGAWAVPDLRDNENRILKHNFAPEMLIRFAAHELKCHIIVIDLHLSKIQFCSGNFVKDGNVVFDSPLLLYSTGSHFQSVFQIDHGFFIQLAKELERENTDHIDSHNEVRSTRKDEQNNVDNIQQESGNQSEKGTSSSTDKISAATGSNEEWKNRLNQLKDMKKKSPSEKKEYERI